MKRNLIILLMIFITGLIVSCSKNRVEEHSTISFMIGDVKKNNADARIGDIIKQNDVIKTAENSFCDVKIGESIIRIKSKTNIVMSTLLRKGDQEHITIGLTTGKMLCKPRKLLKSESFLVKTPTAVAGVRGTQFTVESDKLKTTRIKVFTGKVKVAKRVKQFESSVAKVLEIAPSVEKQEKVVITAKEVKTAERVVQKSLAKEAAGKVPSDMIIEKVINNTRSQVALQDKNIEKFTAEEFTKENKEIIDVKEKPKEVIVKIARVIKQEKEAPKPDGRLLVTRYDIYFIKQGKIRWEGKLVEAPVKEKDRLYVASGNFVFCASVDGPVLWKKNIKNDGKVTLKEGKVILKALGKDIPLDPVTGDKL